jgi:hypothetical protein
MKTFKDLEFNEHPNGMGGVQAKIQFPNGFGASVVKTPFSYGGKNGQYELAVFGQDGNITYDTPITNDVLGYLSETAVSTTLAKIQSL